MVGTLSIVMLVVGVTLIIVIHVAVAVWALRRGSVERRSPVGEHGEEDGGCRAGLSAEEINELPCHDIEQEGGAGECAVCLEAFQAGDRRRVLPFCKNGFHAQCVDLWLRKSRRCPVCRAEVIDGGNTANAVAGEVAISTEILGVPGQH